MRYVLDFVSPPTIPNTTKYTLCPTNLPRRDNLEYDVKAFNARASLKLGYQSKRLSNYTQMIVYMSMKPLGYDLVLFYFLYFLNEDRRHPVLTIKRRVQRR